MNDGREPTQGDREDENQQDTRMLPVITLIALGVPNVFTGALITEQIFRVPGIGSLLISSIQTRDTPVVMAVTFIYAILIVCANLIADVLYGALDPRIRFA